MLFPRKIACIWEVYFLGTALGRLATGEPLHAVLALDVINDRLFVVTVYKPSLEDWKNDWRTRKN
jgi:hypothetical protein